MREIAAQLQESEKLLISNPRSPRKLEQDTYWLAAQNLERLKFRYWSMAKFAYGEQVADEIFPRVVKFAPPSGEEPLTVREELELFEKERYGDSKPASKNFRDKTTTTLKRGPEKKSFLASVRSFWKAFKGSSFQN